VQTHEIRRRFLDHFVRAGHAEVPSASLVLDDPNLLFVNAGMVPFKPYFLGQETPEHATATSIQKCVRTLDIEEVGITTRHNTFFQMAGNFSFGDYFKEGAIRHAWALLTTSVEDGGFGIDPELLWVTVYLDDDEAFGIWRDVVGIPAERIQRRGMADNYWSMGVPGPCGPCSEIFYDRGPAYGLEGGPEADEDRYIEIWNLVFMQNERGEGTGKDAFEILGPLPKQNIDTGMGVERVAFLLQGVENVYETDLLRPVIDTAERLSGAQYGADHASDVRFRVIADHARTAYMLISDGVTPGNEGRGYILRRLLRRIVRSVRLLGATGDAMAAFMATVREAIGPSFPETVAGYDRIERIAVAEEVAFLKTLESGTQLFERAAEAARESGAATLSGRQAFALHDTHGFPIDLTLEMAAEAGLTVDEEGFRSLMSEQRARAKADSQSKKHAHADLSVYRDFLDAGETVFTGFSELTDESTLVGIVSGGDSVRVAREGDQVEFVLDRTPFYAESGGQLGDRGMISTAGFQMRVDDVQKIGKKLWVHKGVLTGGEVEAGQPRARRAPADPRAGGGPGGLSQQAGLHAVRLQLVGLHPGRRPGAGRGDHQRGRGRRLRREHGRDLPRRGQADGRDGPVRGELRVPRPGGGDRRPVLHGAVRRHPRVELRPDRPRHPAGRGVGGIGYPPRGGLRRHGRLPAPGPRTRAGLGPGHLAQGAHRRAARPRGRAGGQAPGRGEGPRGAARGVTGLPGRGPAVGGRGPRRDPLPRALDPGGSGG
jgi:alanyl-tRNA synthetase